MCADVTEELEHYPLKGLSGSCVASMLLSKASSFHVTLSQPTAPHPQPLEWNSHFLRFSFYFYRYISVCMCRVLAAAYAGSLVAICKLSCSMCVLVPCCCCPKSLPEQGSNPGPRHWGVQSLSHRGNQGSPLLRISCLSTFPLAVCCSVNTCERESSGKDPAAVSSQLC